MCRFGCNAVSKCLHTFRRRSYMLTSPLFRLILRLSIYHDGRGAGRDMPGPFNDRTLDCWQAFCWWNTIHLQFLSMTACHCMCKAVILRIMQPRWTCALPIGQADDAVIFAPSAKGLQQLLDICSKFALSHNVVFNVVKSQCFLVSSRSETSNFST